MRRPLIALSLALAAALPAAAQVPIKVGDVAPDFAFRAATAKGVEPAARRLADFRGQTVVLAFFYRARTGG